MTVTSCTVHAHGVDFHVELSSPRASHQILCIPGALGTARSHFGPQLEAGLDGDENLGLVSFDPRGLGASQTAGPRDYPLDYYDRDAADAAAIMKALGYDSYSVLGWSDGANAALKLAASKQSGGNISNLVVWGGNAYFTADEVKQLEQQLDSSQWPDDVLDFLAPAVGGVAHLESQTKLLVAAIKNFMNDRGGVVLTEKELNRVPCRTLIFHGINDELIGVEHARYLAQHIPKSKLVVFPDAGHDLHLTLTDRFGTIVHEFLLEE